MLSENIRIIAAILGEQWRSNVDEIHAIENGAMTLAYGYVIGTLLNEADKLEEEGR